MSEQEAYIPNARDSIVGYFGKTPHGVLRAYCVRCHDKAPITGYGPDGQHGPDRIYGDLYVATGERSRMEPSEYCDMCGVTFLSLSESCQREHDDQQARFARQPVHYLNEYGVRALIRCRVY